LSSVPTGSGPRFGVPSASHPSWYCSTRARPTSGMSSPCSRACRSMSMVSSRSSPGCASTRSSVPARRSLV